MVGLKYELTNIRLDQRGLYSLLHSQRGPVANHIRSVGRQTVLEAKLLVGVRTGRLRSSIKMERDRSGGVEYAVLVGSDVKHALVHHQGARPRVITANRPGGMLKFRQGAATVYASRVNWPGHKKNEYLTKALRIAMAR